MKHLNELWQTVAAYSTPAHGTTREEFEAMFRSADEFIDEKIRQAGLITFDSAANQLIGRLEGLAVSLSARLSELPPEGRNAEAEEIAALIRKAVSSAFCGAIDELAARAARAGALGGAK